MIDVEVAPAMDADAPGLVEAVDAQRSDASCTVLSTAWSGVVRVPSENYVDERASSREGERAIDSRAWQCAARDAAAGPVR